MRRLPHCWSAVAGIAGLALMAPALGVAAPLVAEYEVHAAGLTVMRVQAFFDLDAPDGGYRVATRIRMSGMVGLFASGDQLTSVDGRWSGLDPMPEHYRVEGTWRGGPRQVVMDYGPGSTPVLHALVPANQGREEVPAALQRGTMDGLSALAKLSRVVARTGRCDTAAPVFDGRRRADYRVSTAGLDLLPDIAGRRAEALRCGFESRLLAGRLADQDPEEARRPQPATAWLAPVGPGGAMVPVRVELPSRWFGTIRAELTRVAPAPPGSGPQQLAQQRR